MPPKKADRLQMTNIEQLRVNIAGLPVSARGQALEDLIHLFKTDTHKRGALKSKEYLSLLEALFMAARIDQSLLPTNKSGSKTALERLALCGQALRDLVMHGVPKFRPNTVKAVIDHITDTLPDRDGGFYEPLARNYLEALAMLLGHPGHVENLACFGGEVWMSCVEFILARVSYLVEDMSSATRTATQRGQVQPQPQHLEFVFLFRTLLSLVSASNAPCFQQRNEISDAALQVLKLSTNFGKLHRVAFGTLNCILLKTAGQDPELGQSITTKVIPLLSLWWEPRAIDHDNMLLSVRDEMIMTIHGIHLYLDSILKNSASPSLLSQVEDLLDKMWTEYSRRSSQTRLRLEDLTFSSSPLPSGHFSTGIFALRPFSGDAERRWAALDNMARVENIFQRYNSAGSQHPKTDDEQPRKKARLVGSPNRLHQKLRTTDSRVSLTALQLMPFFLSLSSVPEEEIADIVDDLIPIIGDKQGARSTWALIACASCATRPSVKGQAFEAKWKQVWQLAVRSVSIASTCRAACVLMSSMLASQLLPHHVVADDINNMVTMADICGPSVLLDSSLVFMNSLANIRNELAPSAIQTTSSNIIRWVFSTWKPAETSYALSHAINMVPIDLVNLLLSCCGSSLFEIQGQDQLLGGPIVEFWQSFRDSAQLTKYLLLLDDDQSGSSFLFSQARLGSSHNHTGQAFTDEVTNSSSHNFRSLVLELLLPKLDEFAHLLVPTSNSVVRGRAEASVKISDERLGSLLSCLMSSSILLPFLQIVDSRIATDIKIILDKLWDKCFDMVLASPDNDEPFELILASIRPYLPPLDEAKIEGFCTRHTHLLRLCVRISELIRGRSARRLGDQNVDAMEVDDEFDSQSSDTHHRSSKSTSLSRLQTTSSMSASSYFEATKMRLYLLSEYAKDPQQIGLLPDAVLEDLLSLDAETFLKSGSFVLELLQSNFNLATYAKPIVEQFGDILRQNSFWRCDTALCFCADMLTSLAPHWSLRGPDENFNDLCMDLYNFLVKEAWPGNYLSTNAQIALTGLLYRLIEIQSSFWKDKRAKVHEPRVTLLDFLSQGGMRVKFSIGLRFTEYFNLYAVKEHESIYLNIVDHLPSDSGVMEGIALRVFILANLGSKCPTLLRNCVFHIAEVPDQVPGSAKYATHGMRTIAAARSLKSPQELLLLFAPQILYTWLEEDSIESIPYVIFDFATLDDLLADVQTEAAALMIMRGQGKSFENLANRLKLAPEQMIQQGFSTVFAYSIGYDIAVKINRGESLIKMILGQDLFLECINRNFADIVAEFFALTNQEDTQVEASWAKDPTLDYAATIMKDIKDCGYSPTTLPRDQQPNYKGKQLIRQLRWLTNYAQHGPDVQWTPPLVASVGRSLFNTIHPALGPHHALSVVRKIRMLVCLAGPQAASLYPLEMLLRSVRPLISDPECADDALGITQWLIANGKNHLVQAPSFLAGYALSTLASLRMFLDSSQSSASQESQFKATIDRAHQFHTWFVKFLKGYQSDSFKSETQALAFRAITDSAANIRNFGNSEKDTPESKLLLEIFKDAEQDDQLLNEASRDLALKMLCSDFRIPRTNKLDMLESDADACVHGPMVWKSCQAVELSKEYLTWAGRVVGRSFASSGNVPDNVLRESLLSTYQKTAKHGDSIHGLLRLLANLTLSDNSTHAGLAESAVRRIISFANSPNPDNRDHRHDQSLIADCNRSLPEVLSMSSDWASYSAPPSDCVELTHPGHDVLGPDKIDSPSWAKNLSVHLSTFPQTQTILDGFSSILDVVDGFAEQALPYIVHLVLWGELDTQRAVKRSLSPAIAAWLRSDSPEAMANLKLLINVILYLRSRALPGEASIMDRSGWLDVDSSTAAAAATRCGMFKVALMFAELALSDFARTSRRSSAFRDAGDSSEMLLEIFENIDDPDAYYGLERPASITNVLARLEYENEGGKSLAFRGAQYDSHLRMRDSQASCDGQSLVKILSGLGLAGLSDSLLQTNQRHDDSDASLSTTFTTARRLEKWNLPAPPTLENHAALSYRVYQSIHKAVEVETAVEAIREGLASTMKRLVAKGIKASNLRQQLGTLAALTELDDVLGVADSSALEQILNDFEARSKWMMSGSYDDVNQILSHRQTTLSLLSHKHDLRAPKITSPEARLVEVRSMLLSSRIFRFHRARQEALSISTTLRDLVAPSGAIGITIDAAVRLDEAHSLWEYGEMISSTRVLQGLHDDAATLKKQSVPVSHAEILSKIGYQVSVAKLETADSIQKQYLEPALKVLKGAHKGEEAGEVYHRFAIFCDEQLQDPDMLEDLARLDKLVQSKTEEVAHYKNEAKHANPEKKERWAQFLNKSLKYLKLDQDEFQLVQKTRNEFVKLSLENYLQALAASDNHDNDALRFTALWLERSENEFATRAVHAHLNKVPTRKFAALMNQLSSRMQLQDDSNFQNQLMGLVLAICRDHPYHGMYQIWAGTMSWTVRDDIPAARRRRANSAIASELIKNNSTKDIWMSIDRTNDRYHQLASSDRGEKPKSGTKINVKDSPLATQLATALSRYRIPPPTLEIELSPDKDYSRIPVITKMEPTMTVAGGLSAPKIITVVASNGERYKQLVKGGNDDLRQDAIMEQVFAAVSSLLKQHRKTRQRNLGIRTYKVLPLTPKTGIIEFVANTQPLHDWLIPAHSRYYPKGLKASQCRKQIEEVQDQTTNVRIAAYRRATDKFPPVMRYFFLESSPDPDDWHARRLAYTRSTAAVSILGHVLGLGDRHGHNILLDKKTGEAVHIDLGVAFDAGRILPIPEVVPFRLTRDIVDGMGITKTDGVFRRCCEFTLDALREDTYSIMTILDVLRYDPLYSWSSTPVRLAKLQLAARRGEKDDDEPGSGDMGKKKMINEPSEADRALEVVRKKLSKTLSVTATVNALINQATDEKNLAVLYAGWAAYA